jgi:hypothetical protein
MKHRYVRPKEPRPYDWTRLKSTDRDTLKQELIHWAREVVRLGLHTLEGCQSKQPRLY